VGRSVCEQNAAVRRARMRKTSPSFIKISAPPALSRTTLSRTFVMPELNLLTATRESSKRLVCPERSQSVENLENDRRLDRPHPCRNRCQHAAEHWLVPRVGGTGFSRPSAYLRVWYPLVRRWTCHCARSQSLDEWMAGACDSPWLACRF
jgi:hypothetical protein